LQKRALVHCCSENCCHCDETCDLYSAVLVISVPLREFTVSVDDIGPPVRADRVREWAFPEMQALLDSAGLDAVFGGLVPATAANPVGQTGVFVCVRRLDQG